MTATEHPESVALRHPGATQSPDGSQGAPEGPRGAEGATGHGISAVPHLETAPLPSASDVRPSPTARDAVSDAEAAEWERLAGEATEPVTATCIACGTRVPIDQSCPQCRATRETKARRARLRAASA